MVVHPESDRLLAVVRLGAGLLGVDHLETGHPGLDHLGLVLLGTDRFETDRSGICRLLDPQESDRSELALFAVERRSCLDHRLGHLVAAHLAADRLGEHHHQSNWPVGRPQPAEQYYWNLRCRRQAAVGLSYALASF